MPRAIAEVIESKGETTIVVPADELLRISEYLATDPGLLFSFLSDISAVDRFPLEPRFEVNYHLVSLEKQARLAPESPAAWPGSCCALRHAGLAHGQLARA